MLQLQLRPARALLALLLALGLAAPVVAILTPTARAAIPYTDNDYEVFGQLQPPASSSGLGGGACCPTSSGVTLSAGTSYYFYVATNQGNSISACISSTSNSATCDVVSANANGAVVVAGAKASKADLVQSVNVSAGVFTHDYMVLKVTMAQSATTFFQSAGSPNNNFGNGWVLPAGAAGAQNARTGILGYVGEWCYGTSSCPATTAGYVLLASTPSALSESGILSTETTPTPTSSQFSFAQIGEGGALVSASGTGAGNMNSAEWAQSFSADATKGTYLSASAWSQSFSSSCSGTLSVSIAQTLTFPWDTSRELANLTASMTSTATSGTTATVTVDWVNGIISSTSGQLAFGTPTYSVGGSTVTSLATFAPAILSGTYYLRVRDTTCTTALVASPSYYAGGDVWKQSGGTWTESPTLDVQGLTLKAYGGTTEIFSLPFTSANVGGAYYVYVKELLKDSNPQQYGLTSSFGGRAIFAGFQEGGTGYVIQEWRLGYLARPWNTSATLTVTLNTTGSGRNLLFAGTLTGTQPTHPHLWNLAWSATGQNSLNAYGLYSTDDYATFAQFNVSQCLDSTCLTLGDPVPGAAYFVTVCPTTNGRTLAGNADASATFNVSGQDLAGCLLTVILTDSNHAQTSWSVRIPAPGSYNFTLGMFQTVSTTGTATLNAVAITFSGNATRVVPARVNLTISRSLPTVLWVDQVLIDARSGTFRRVGSPQPWSATDPATFTFLYPPGFRNASQARDVGQYVVFVTDGNGTYLGGEGFCLLSAWDPGASFACNVTVSPGDQLTLAQDDALAVAQKRIELSQQRQADLQDQAVDYVGQFIVVLFRPDYANTPNICWGLIASGMILASGTVGGIGGGRRRR